MRLLRSFPAMLVACLMLVCIGHAQSSMEDDTLIALLHNQMAELYRQYQSKDVPVCKMSLSVVYRADAKLSSTMGSSMENAETERHFLSVQMWVGNAQNGNVMEGKTNGSDVLLPIDFNERAISSVIARETEKVYQEISKQYQKRILRQELGLERISFTDCISNASEQHIEPCPKDQDLDLALWKQRLNECTKAWNTFDWVEKGTASLHYTFIRKYVIGSDGSEIVTNHRTSVLTLEASQRTPKGNWLSVHKSFLAEYPDELPSEQSIIQEETKLQEQLQNMIEAPMGQATVCPVLISNEAAGGLLYRLYHFPGFSAEASLPLWLKEDADIFSVSANTPLSEEIQCRLMKEELKRQNASFGYRIHSWKDISLEGNLIHAYPQEIFKVFADERPDELVSGMVMTISPTMLASQIIAAGGTLYCTVETEVPFDKIPVKCCAPSFLIQQVEMNPQWPQGNHRTLFSQIEPADYFEEDVFAEILEKAVKDEMTAILQDTTLIRTPYEMEFLITDAQIMAAEGMCGSITKSYEYPVRNAESRIWIGSDRLNNDNFLLQSAVAKPTNVIPLDNHYKNIRRVLHASLENPYREALLNYQIKEKIRQQQTYFPLNTQYRDRSSITQKTSFSNIADNEINLPMLNQLASEYSNAFVQDSSFCNGLTYSKAVVYAYQAWAYFYSSTKVQYAQPFNLIKIQLSAETKNASGETISDCKVLFFNQLPSFEEIKTEVDNMLQHLWEMRAADKITEYYHGPVLFCGEASAQLFAHAFLEGDPSLIASPSPMGSNGEEGIFSSNLWNTQVGKKVVGNIVNIQAVYDWTERERASLIGYYDMDADGSDVPKTTELIKNGVLNDLLSNRTPSKAEKYSNGHQRLALSEDRLVSMCGAGILEMSCDKAVEEKAIERELCRLARTKGYKYAYVIEKLADRNMNVSDSSCTFPVYLYRMNVITGKKEAVRSAQLSYANVNLFNHLLLSSKTTQSYNTLVNGQEHCKGSAKFPLSGIPCSVIIPKLLLFDNVGILPVP